MGWPFSNTKHDEPVIVVEADALPQFGYYDRDLDFAASADEPLDFNELDVETEEYYCGLCRCLVPLSSGLHPHN